jgi:TolB-like protein/DNA-binding winged helix-turn-helix (wHTH) protein
MSEETGWRSTSKDFREAPRLAEQRLPGGIPEIYEFGPFRLEPAERKLLRGNEVVALTPKAFDTLYILVRESGHLVVKDELIRMLWPHSVVEEGNLTNNIFQLRKALGEDPQYIETVPRKGYRFVGAVRRLPEAERTPPEKPPDGDTEGLRWSRPTVLAVLAAVLIVVGGAGMYVYSQRTGQRAAGASPTIHSLAVLPLENLSGDKEQEYFADGMTDALITDLAQIGSLRVISRTSAMRFKGSKETLTQIGQDLKVDAVVEGTVAHGEGRVRITAQLIQASSDQHLWARTYERDSKNVLALQDEIAQDITEQIRIKLTPKERSLLTQTHPVDPEAYDAYLRGSYWLSQANLEGWTKACGYFRKAIAKDPSYALAYVGVAKCFTPEEDAAGKPRETLVKALALDPSLAEAHSLLATMKFTRDWDWPGVEAEYKQAIALNPNCAPAHRWYSFYLVAMDRLDEAMREIESARDLDPYSAAITHWRGQVLYHARRYDDALRENRRGVEMHPNTRAFPWDMADIYEQKKMFAEAFTARQQALRLDNDPRVTALDEAYKRSGYKGYLLKQAEFEQTHNPSYAAHIYALLNDEPRAIAAMEETYNKHDLGVLFMRSAPEMDSIRSSPRFRDLVRRMGFPASPSDKN